VPIANSSALPLGGVDALPADGSLAELLVEARRRTLALVEPLTEDQVNRQFSPIMSPLAWDIGHIAAFADLWVSRAVPSREPLRPDLFEVYDATETPRAGRGELPYLRCHEALAYGDAVLERALAGLSEVDVSPAGDRLNAGGFVWHMLIQHEHQHNETMVQAMQLAGGAMPAPLSRSPNGGRSAAAGSAPTRGAATSETVLFPGGRAPIGADAAGFAYDNERPRHEVELAAFELDAAPVTNGAFGEWVEAGGYAREKWWSPAGWAWRVRDGAKRPLYWTEDGLERRFDHLEEIDPDLPVTHVSWFEADAYAHAHGRRLPTELEWEAAATWDAETARQLPFPWGDEAPVPERANLDVSAGGPAPAGALAAGAAPCGALGMVGDVWEWTASELRGYPGFAAFPYHEYSEIFFGTGLRVLRGGSWATRPTLARPTFRNWDLPHRRQIFAGFRCVRDV